MRPRLHNIVQRLGPALLACAQAREPMAVAGQTAASLVGRFAAADPSVNKGGTDWLIRNYLARHIRMEDLGKATETLVLFRRNRRRLEADRRDILRYGSLGDLWEAVAPFQEQPRTLAGREARRAERERVRSETRILLEREDGFTVVVPLTENAAKWWGRGTRWCTSAEDDNFFEDYNRRGPLVVIVLPSGQKLQLFVVPGEIQFMDEADRRARGVLSGKREYLLPIARWAAARNAHFLDYLPAIPEFRDIYLDVVRRSGLMIQKVPQEMRDAEMCMAAVKQNGRALNMVPARLRTRELCEVAIASDGQAIRDVPLYLHDRRMFLMAVRENGGALGAVPYGLRDAELCEIAVSKTPDALGCVPDPLRSQRLCDLAMSLDHGYWCLRDVPTKLLTRDLCLAEVKRSGQALLFVPMPFRDREVCEAAVARHGPALAEVPIEMRDRAMCAIALASNGFALKSVPGEFVDRDMCMAAVSSNGMALEGVPDRFKDKEICLAAVRQEGRALVHVPLPLRDLPMCSVAVRQHKDAMFHVRAEEIRSVLHDRLREQARAAPIAWGMDCLDSLEQMLSEMRPDAGIGGPEPAMCVAV